MNAVNKFFDRNQLGGMKFQNLWTTDRRIYLYDFINFSSLTPYIYIVYIKLSLIRLQFIRMSDVQERNMKNKKFCSQLSTYFKRRIGFRSKRD
jgi:hypothetical protein